MEKTFIYSLITLPLEAQKPTSDSLCYIATACYGDLYSSEVILLRKFRDEHLKSTSFGKTFIIHQAHFFTNYY